MTDHDLAFKPLSIDGAAFVGSNEDFGALNLSWVRLAIEVCNRDGAGVVKLVSDMADIDDPVVLADLLQEWRLIEDQFVEITAILQLAQEHVRRTAKVLGIKVPRNRTRRS
jgi:hypothetical protein